MTAESKSLAALRTALLPNGGDVLLFHRPTTWANFRADPKGTLFTALIHAATKSRWNHAAIMVDPGGDGRRVYAEATAGGVAITPYGTSGDEVELIRMHFTDEDDRLEAVAWARARTGVRYGYLNAIVCGLNNLFVGLGFVVKKTDTVICSELVAEALERAGFDFGKDSCQVSPGDLADAFGVQR